MDVEVKGENAGSVVGLQGLNPSTLNVTRRQNPAYHKPEILIVHKKRHTRRDGSRGFPFV